MFDFGMSEMLVCAAVGLVILGPERLPTVARTAGQWLGKARQYITDLKRDIDREAELSEIKKLRDDVEGAAKSISNDFQKTVDDVKKTADSISGSVSDAAQSVDEAGKEIEKTFQQATDSRAAGALPEDAGQAAPDDTPADDTTYDWSDSQDYTEGYEGYEPMTTVSTVFPKRYHPGPSFDQITEQVDEMRRALALNDPRASGNSHKYAPRARSNRTRIYR